MDDVEKKCMDTLREKFPGVSDVTLHRFAVARDFDIPKATEMYANYVKWRSQYPKKIDISDCGTELGLGIWYFHGISKQGYPVAVLKAARFYPAQCKQENLTKMAIYAMEEIFAHSPEEKVVALVDYRGFGYANVSYETIRWLIALYSDYYPEVLHAEYVLNAPWIFTQLWEWNRKFIDDRTASKIHILPAEREQYLPEILKTIDIENLERWCGGKSTYRHRFRDASGSNPCIGAIQDRTELNTDDDAGDDDEGLEKKSYVLPEMQPDADVTVCNNCKVAFGWFTRKHHCRTCGLIYCSKCCGHMVTLPKEYKLQGPQRVCLHCEDEFAHHT